MQANRIIVLDTNCLLQIISRRSPYHAIWEAFVRGAYTLCVSNEILDEYQEILGKQISPSIADNIVILILNKENVKFVHPTFRFNLIVQDVDDNKFVDCAIVGNADYIVSNDSHFRILREIPFPKVNVVTMQEFLERL